MEEPTFWISERNANLARLAIGLTSPLVPLCVLTLCARIYVRSRPVFKLGFDDLFIFLGAVGFFSCWMFVVASLQNGTAARTSSSLCSPAKEKPPYLPRGVPAIL